MRNWAYILSNHKFGLDFQNDVDLILTRVNAGNSTVLLDTTSLPCSPEEGSPEPLAMLSVSHNTRAKLFSMRCDHVEVTRL